MVAASVVVEERIESVSPTSSTSDDIMEIKPAELVDGEGSMAPDAVLPAERPSLDATRAERDRLVCLFVDLIGTPSMSKLAWDTCRRTVEFLYACEFSDTEVCTLMAHASKYFVDVHERCGDQMTRDDVGYIVVVAAYIAHSYVLDETSGLRAWHRCLCRTYCNMKQLDVAVFRVMQMRGFVLRLEDEDLKCRFGRLRAAFRCDRQTIQFEEFVASGPTTVAIL